MRITVMIERIMKPFPPGVTTDFHPHKGLYSRPLLGGQCSTIGTYASGRLGDRQHVP